MQKGHSRVPSCLLVEAANLVLAHCSPSSGIVSEYNGRSRLAASSSEREYVWWHRSRVESLLGFPIRAYGCWMATLSSKPAQGKPRRCRELLSLLWFTTNASVVKQASGGYCGWEVARGWRHSGEGGAPRETGDCASSGPGHFIIASETASHIAQHQPAARHCSPPSTRCCVRRGQTCALCAAMEVGGWPVVTSEKAWIETAGEAKGSLQETGGGCTRR